MTVCGVQTVFADRAAIGIAAAGVGCGTSSRCRHTHFVGIGVELVERPLSMYWLSRGIGVNLPTLPPSTWMVPPLPAAAAAKMKRAAAAGFSHRHCTDQRETGGDADGERTPHQILRIVRLLVTRLAFSPFAMPIVTSASILLNRRGPAAFLGTALHRG